MIRSVGPPLNSNDRNGSNPETHIPEAIVGIQHSIRIENVVLALTFGMRMRPPPLSPNIVEEPQKK